MRVPLHWRPSVSNHLTPMTPLPHHRAANAEDVATAEKCNTAAPLLGRLKLSHEKLAQLARAPLPDPPTSISHSAPHPRVPLTRVRGLGQ